MDFITEPLERRLWPPHRRYGPVSRRLTLARYTYALLRDLLVGDLTLRAMSLVYTTMLAVVPLLAFSFSVLKGLGFHRQLEPLLDNFFAPLGQRADELTDQIIGFVDNVSGSALASISIVLLLYTALSMAQKVEASFNFVWRVDRPRSFARRFSEYLSVMFVGPIVMSIAFGFIATIASKTATSHIREVEPIGDWILRGSALLPYLVVIGGFTFLYMFVPNTRVRFKPAILGGTFAGVLWATTGSLFTSFVVSVSRTEAIYSGFAIVIVAMLWLQLSWLILLLGAQLAFYLQNPEYLRLGQRTEVMSNALRERLALSVMLLVGRDFEQPGHGWRIESLSARIRIARHFLEPVVQSLTRAGLVTRTAENRLMPARDPRRMPVCEILDAVRNADRDPHHAPGSEWNPTVRAVSEEVESAIRATLGERTLADIVDQDIATDAARAEEDAPASPHKGPRAVARHRR